MANRDVSSSDFFALRGRLPLGSAASRFGCCLVGALLYGGCGQTAPTEQNSAIALPSDEGALASVSGTAAVARTLGPNKQRHPLGGVASIVAADIESAVNDYDDRLGPRTIFSLANVEVYAGNRPLSSSFALQGGELPDGRVLTVSEQPQLETGHRYVFFFGRQAALNSPIWGNLVFEVVRQFGREFVLSEDGRAVQAFGEKHVELGTTPFFQTEASDHLATTPSREPAFELLSPRALSNIKPADAEMTNSLTSQAFGAAARKAVEAVGGPLGADVNLEPPADVAWNAPVATNPQ